MQDSNSTGTFGGVQALRFFAAFLVVLNHATSMVVNRGMTGQGVEYWGNGAAGVDIFFVISGFVMAITAGPLIGRRREAEPAVTPQIVSMSSGSRFCCGRDAHRSVNATGQLVLTPGKL